MLPHNQVAHRRFHLQFQVFSNHPETIQECHVVCLELLDHLCLGYLHIDGDLLQTEIDDVQRHHQHDKEQPAQWIPLTETTHQTNRPFKKPLIFLVEEDAEICQCRIREQRNDDKEKVAIQQGAPEKIPIAVQHIHEPPTHDEADKSHDAVKLRNGAKSERHKEERPKEVVRLHSHTQQKGVQEKARGNVVKLVLFDVLGRRFLHGETGEKIDNEEPNHSSVNPVESLQCRTFKIRISGEAQHDQIDCPKGDEDVTQNLHCQLLLKHRMATCLQPLIVRNKFI